MRRLLYVALAGGVAAVAFVVVRDVRRGYRTTHGFRVKRFALRSRLTGRELREILVVPPSGGRGRPRLVFLHGRGSGASSNLSQQLFDELRRLGRRAPVVFLPDGGDHSYWHDRGDGRWGADVLREAIPQALRRSGASRQRVAIGGISMGGFGALDLGRLAPQRFCAVGTHAPALWTSGGETPAGAFDDDADFARHDLIRFARDRPLVRVPVWIDVGRGDPFASADTTLADELRAQGVRVSFTSTAAGTAASRAGCRSTWVGTLRASRAADGRRLADHMRRRRRARRGAPRCAPGGRWRAPG